MSQKNNIYTNRLASGMLDDDGNPINISVGENLTAETAFTYDGLEDNDYVTKRVLTEKIPEGPAAATIRHLPAGSSIPTTIDTATDYPGLNGKFLVYASIYLGGNKFQRTMDIEGNVIYSNTTFPIDVDITSVDVYGHPDDDDPTITQDDVYLILIPI